MFKQTQIANGIGALMKRHHQCLLICDKDEVLQVVPAKQSRYNTVSILPINGATVTLKVPDSETKLDAGNGEQDEITFSGQNIVTLYSDGKWYVAGIQQQSKPEERVGKRPVGRPRKVQPEAALT